MRSLFSKTVTRASELLRCGQARGARSDHSHAFTSASLRRLRLNPAFRERVIDDGALDHLDRDRRFIDSEHARGLARSGADPPGELGKIVGGMQHAHRRAPPVAIDQIVPVGNDVVERTAGVAERHAAIHAASALFTQLFFRKILIDFKPIIDPLGHWPARSQFPRVIHEAGRLTHVAPAQAASARRLRERERADLGYRLARCDPLPALA